MLGLEQRRRRVILPHVDGGAQRSEHLPRGGRRQHRETVDDEREPVGGGRRVEEAGGDAEELSSGELAQQ